MPAKILFWGSTLFILIGFKAREGHLFFFFGVYMLMSATGLFFRCREAREKKKTAAESLPTVNSPTAPSSQS